MSKLYYIENSKKGVGADSVDPDEAAHDELPHLDLQCLLIQLFSAHLDKMDKVQEELLYYPCVGVGVAAVSALAKCLSFYVKVFYLMGKALSGELSCPCDRSCFV